MQKVATTSEAGRAVVMGDDPSLQENASAKLARKRAEAQRAAAVLNDRADTTTPLIGRAPLETAPEPPLFADDAPAAARAPVVTKTARKIALQTTVEHRGRSFTIIAEGMTLDQLCDLLDERGYAAVAQTQEWQTLPDGTPICPKHHTPMRKRERQGDTWWSHNVAADGDAPVYCKGYVGKDSPGYSHG